MSLWVVDTSPLIFLAKLDRLDLLRASGQAICVPPAVLREITGQDDGAAQRLMVGLLLYAYCHLREIKAIHKVRSGGDCRLWLVERRPSRNHEGDNPWTEIWRDA